MSHHLTGDGCKQPVTPQELARNTHTHTHTHTYTHTHKHTHTNHTITTTTCAQSQCSLLSRSASSKKMVSYFCPDMPLLQRWRAWSTGWTSCCKFSIQARQVCNSCIGTTHTHKHTQARTCSQAYTHIRTCAKHAHTRTRTHTYTLTHKHTYTPPPPPHVHRVSALYLPYDWWPGVYSYVSSVLDAFWARRYSLFANFPLCFFCSAQSSLPGPCTSIPLYVEGFYATQTWAASVSLSRAESVYHCLCSFAYLYAAAKDLPINESWGPLESPARLIPATGQT